MNKLLAGSMQKEDIRLLAEKYRLFWVETSWNLTVSDKMPFSLPVLPLNEIFVFLQIQFTWHEIGIYDEKVYLKFEMQNCYFLLFDDWILYLAYNQLLFFLNKKKNLKQLNMRFGQDASSVIFLRISFFSRLNKADWLRERRVCRNNQLIFQSIDQPETLVFNCI